MSQTLIQDTLVQNANLLEDQRILNELLPFPKEVNEEHGNSFGNEVFSKQHSSQLKAKDGNFDPQANDKKQHVQFSSLQLLYENTAGVNALEAGYDQLCNTGAGHFQSKLADIRKAIGNQADSLYSEDTTDTLPLNQLLMSQLNAQRQKTKDLEEELALAETSLTKATKDLEIVQKRCQRREEHLKNVNVQLDIMHADWKNEKHSMTCKADAARSQVNHLLKENESLKNEKEKLLHTISLLNQECEDLPNIKKRLQEAEKAAASSKAMYEDILEENRRLNQVLQERELKLKCYVDNDLPSLEKEVQALSAINESFKSRNNEIEIEKHQLEEEIQLIKERHFFLLQRAMEDDESKDEISQQMKKLECEVEDQKKEKESIKKEIHNYYQNEVQSIVSKKALELQQQVIDAESKLEESMERMLSTHRKEIENINKKHSEEINVCEKAQDRKMAELQKNFEMLQQENVVLKMKLKTIFTTASVPDYPFKQQGKFSIESHHLNLEEPVKDVFMHAPVHQNKNFDRNHARPFMASTSLSSLCQSEDEIITARRRRLKKKNPTHLKKYDNRIVGAPKLCSAEEILASSDSMVPPPLSRYNNIAYKIPLQKGIDSEMNRIKTDFQKLSVRPACTEKDLVDQTLDRIDKVSNYLLNCT